MINIQEAWRVIQEVWKRLDSLDEDLSRGTNFDLWRNVCAEMGVTIVFG